ncbi:MAG: GspH/FimT family pseudopilin [Acidovorax defluvii]
MATLPTDTPDLVQKRFAGTNENIMKSHRIEGFTLIELLLTIAIVAVLLALAAPSFTAFFAKKRVEGLINELVTDLQYARSEAVQRNTSVQMTLGTNCYVIHALATPATTASANTSCVQTAGTASTIGSGETELKTVKIAAGSSASFSPSTGTIVFDPVRGMATISSGTETITTASTIGSWDLRVNINVMGRLKTCSPSGSGHISGYSNC